MGEQLVPGPGGAMYLLPALQPQQYKTYRLAAPLRTHWRPATCDEVDCPNYRNGWRVRVEGLTPELLHAAIHSGRKCTRVEEGEGVSWLVFEAGQPCFRATTHRIRSDQPPGYLITGGDWRGNPHQVKPRVLTAQSWVDDFGEHQERLADRIGKG